MANININMDSLKTFRKAVRHKVKEGSNIYRFTPPFGEECEGYPYAFWAISWGLSDPTTGNRRPYADCKQTEGKSPIWEYLDLLRLKVEKIKMELAAAGHTEDQIKERLAETNKFISNLRPKTVFAWNAVDKAGSVGILEVKSTAHKQVLKLMNQYIMDYNQDPTSLGSDAADSGVWFDITRTGTSFDTEYSVKKNQTMAKDPTTGVPSYQDDRSPVPETVANDYENHGYDLTSIYQKKTYTELKDILVANITSLSVENPDLYIEEFVSAIAPASQPAPIAEVVPLPQGTIKPAIKLGPIEEETPVAPTPVGADTGEEDLMAMAEGIFAQGN